MTHSSQLNINTDNAEIIIKKLVNHWRHKIKLPKRITSPAFHFLKQRMQLLNIKQIN